MSYCRFTDNCDVYAYDSVEGGVRFYVSHGRNEFNRLCGTYNEAYQYAKTLRDVYGLNVPDYAIEALRADAAEEVNSIGVPIVRELQAENAKLREERRAYQATIDSLVDECTDYETENAKLRELVEELWALADGYTPDDSELDTARDLMRELGIDVEE